MRGATSAATSCLKWRLGEVEQTPNIGLRLCAARSFLAHSLDLLASPTPNAFDEFQRGMAVECTWKDDCVRYLRVSVPHVALDHKKVEVTIGTGVSTRMRAEQHHASRPMGRRCQPATRQLDDIAGNHGCAYVALA